MLAIFFDPRLNEACQVLGVIGPDPKSTTAAKVQHDPWNFWVFRIEKRDPQGSYTTSQTTQLAQKKLDAAVADLRLTTKISRSLDPSDVAWAESHSQ